MADADVLSMASELGVSNRIQSIMILELTLRSLRLLEAISLGRRSCAQTWVGNQRQRRVHRLSPAQQRHVIESVDDLSLEMKVELEVHAILDVVGADACDATVDDHVLGVERADDGAVVVL